MFNAKFLKDSEFKIKSDDKDKLPMILSRDTINYTSIEIERDMEELEDHILNQRVVDSKVAIIGGKFFKAKYRYYLKLLTLNRLNPDNSEGIEPLVVSENKLTIKRGKEFVIVNKYLGLSERFWDEIILPEPYQKLNDYSKNTFWKSTLRWDIFEEMFFMFLIQL